MIKTLLTSDFLNINLNFFILIEANTDIRISYGQKKKCSYRFRETGLNKTLNLTLEYQNEN